MQFEEHYERRVRPLPDQDQRLPREAVTDRPGRRARPWIVVALGLLLVAVFVAIVAIGSDEEPDGPIGAPSATAD